MRVLNKSLKVLLLGTTLMTSAKAADLTLTAAEYASLSGTVAVGSPEADKAIGVANVVGSGLDKGYLGTVSASSESYIYYDSGKLKALAIISGKWCTFESGVLSTISASSQIHLTQTKEDGSNVTTKKLTISLTKASTGQPISAVALSTWLQTALTSSTQSFSASALKTLSAPASGWTAKALFQLASGTNIAADAVAATLDPIAFTLTAPVTPAAGGTAVNYTAVLADISAYSVALNNGYSASLDLVNGANTLTLALKPGKIVDHATSIMEGLVSGANDLVRKRLKISFPFTYPIPSDAVNSVRAVIGAVSPSAIAEDLAMEHARLAANPAHASTDTLRETVGVLLESIAPGATNMQTDLAAEHARLATNPVHASTDTLREAVDVILAQISPTATNVQTALADIVLALGGATLKEGLTVVAKGYVDSDNFTYADCSHTGAPDGVKYGAVAFTSHNITSLTGWKAVGDTVQVSGQVNGNTRTFTCSVSGLQKFLDDTESGTQKKVLGFTSAEGDVFWIKAFDATGLDASAHTPIAFKDDYLAFLIASKFSTVTAIAKKTLPELNIAAAS
ncbi:hypothetical protein [Candidatus Bodocaedibacter vickermanii]|uniref:Uncharacterized protein n=1 Tax=Candidatus Bodocaedibacter vickermanii TaxID=2741701 RepID=A0A7L9RT52_9PROT|nr:hypothetical protein CPBP_00532 [Candidatus Paracaedibacteraceae bacterium 'Lake Konstanz']